MLGLPGLLSPHVTIGSCLWLQVVLAYGLLGARDASFPYPVSYLLHVHQLWEQKIVEAVPYHLPSSSKSCALIFGVNRETCLIA